ncbi:MAG: HNH endonuclease [Candidatus Woesearchaeota archaeon]
MITEKNRLTIELVPSTVWYASVYQYYKKQQTPQKWQEIKNELFVREGRTCWICGEEHSRLEAHEFWSYDDTNHIQKLEAIHHLCGFYHKIKHIGLWLHTTDGENMLKKERLTKTDIINHFCKVNDCTRTDFQESEDEAFKIWNERSKHQWMQDFGQFSAKMM